jgi:hypothetical protein
MSLKNTREKLYFDPIITLFNFPKCHFNLISVYCLQFFKSRPLACDISELPVIINKGDDERPQNKRRKRYAIILELKNLFIPCIMFCVYDISM